MRSTSILALVALLALVAFASVEASTVSLYSDGVCASQVQTTVATSGECAKADDGTYSELTCNANGSWNFAQYGTGGCNTASTLSASGANNDACSIFGPNYLKAICTSSAATSSASIILIAALAFVASKLNKLM